jgi:uncharacterized protein YhjY with autotransporter beta-barrel domain
MKLMTRGRFACAVLSWIVSAVALLTIAPEAMAQAPSFTGEPIRASMPGQEGSIILNLRQLGVVSGPGPMGISASGEIMRGEVGSGLLVSSYDPYPERTGSVCIRIANNGYEPGSGEMTLFLHAVNESGATNNQTLVFDSPGGPTVDEGDPADREACEDGSVAVNQAPTVTLPQDFTVTDTDGDVGEQRVSLTASVSDPDDAIDTLQYAWYREGNPVPLSTDPNPTVSLQQDGATSIRLRVTDPDGAYDEDEIIVRVNPAQRPIVNAGADRTVADRDGRAGEDDVELNATASDPDGTIVSYTWYIDIGDGTRNLGTGPSILADDLSDGVTTVWVRVTDNVGLTNTDSVLITVSPPPPLTANAGADRTVADSDEAAGERVVLSGTSTAPEGNTVSYTWYRLDAGERERLGAGATLEAPLPDGESVIQLEVIDSTAETSARDEVIISVTPPASSGLPIADAGADQSVADTDRLAGETVRLDGSASRDTNGEIVSYTWSRVNGESVEELGNGATFDARLPDGENTIRLVVTDSSGNTASDTVVITVAAPTAVPTANAGADRIINDTDQQEGEDVLLDGSWSNDADGTIVDFAWSRLDGENAESLGNGVSPTLQTRLRDGDSIIQLVVTDNQGNTASDTVLITVNEGRVVITTLGDLPGLTPNQKQMAQALDRVCGQLRDGDGQLSANQQDLLNRCNGLQMNNTTANQVAALDEIVADDFSVARTQTLLFANTQYAGVMDRLMALRGGAKGLSLAGLNIIVDGSPVPLAQLQEMAKGLLGGGASADEPGGLLNDKWGLWARGNYSLGEKDRNTKSPGFEADQWAMVGGVDYRYNDQIVGGVSLAYGESGIDFDGGEGGLDTTTWAASLYGSSYVAKKFYFDAIINVANADYGADRNIAYVDGAGLVDVDARGDTSGMTYSAGVSGGRDFLYGGFTVSPTLGLFYIDATIDKFTEQGASGLNLIYDEQSFQSFTGNLGFRVTYAWNLSWGVVMPHLRVDYVREFKNDVDVFGVRFAADPNAMSAPPILVATDNPDESYMRLATGLSTQFVDGISGYFEYQRLESFEFISFQDLSLGLRFQKSF